MTKRNIDDGSKQPSIANYFPSAKRPNTEAADNPQELAIVVPILTTVPLHQVDIPEIPIPQQQDINEFPNPMPKTESNHSFQKSWFCDYNWLKLAEEEALKFMMPNLLMLCVIDVCLPVSTCEAERSFSMLRRIHTYLRNTQTQERLNHIGVLCAHRDIARTMELRASMNEFVNSTAQRRITFGHAC